MYVIRNDEGEVAVVSENTATLAQVFDPVFAALWNKFRADGFPFHGGGKQGATVFETTTMMKLDPNTLGAALAYLREMGYTVTDVGPAPRDL